MIKKAAEREAINMPIQWTSADIIKLAMIKADKFLKTNKLNSKLIMQVHDELVFDVYPWEQDVLKGKITEIMENILENKSVKLKVDFNIWRNWLEAK
jgi:DNA polymerase-1